MTDHRKRDPKGRILPVSGIAVGDKVSAPGNPFWMTVTAINKYGLCSCMFGSAGDHAGGYYAHELTHIGGSLADEQSKTKEAA